MADVEEGASCTMGRPSTLFHSGMRTSIDDTTP
jgi:hypothetical protein